MINKQSLFLLSGIFLAGSVAAGPCVAKVKAKPPTLPGRIAVGDYQVSVLRGWKKTVVERPAKTYHDTWHGQRKDFTIGYGKSVTFTKKVGETTVTVGFSVDRHDTAVPPEAVAAGIKRYEEEVVKSRTAKHVPGHVLKSESTKFRRLPAYLSQTRGPADDPRYLTDSRTVTFAEGKNVYTISETMTGMNLEKVEPLAAEGWDALTIGLYRSGPMAMRPVGPGPFGAANASKARGGTTHGKSGH
jgi:hypothetical protein